MGDFRREVRFEPGYNYLHETGPKRRGQHGMGIRFLLFGEEGVTQFLMNTSWTPLGPVDQHLRFEDGYHIEPVHIDEWIASSVPGIAGHKFGYIRPPSGFDIGYHWRVPNYEGQEEYGRMDCDLLPDGTCYYDGSGLQADTVLREFIENGEDAVWDRLEQRYRWCQEAVEEMRRG